MNVNLQRFTKDMAKCDGRRRGPGSGRGRRTRGENLLLIFIMMIIIITQKPFTSKFKKYVGMAKHFSKEYGNKG